MDTSGIMVEVILPAAVAAPVETISFIVLTSHVIGAASFMIYLLYPLLSKHA